MAKRVSARAIKVHRQYTYDEAAETLGVGVGTVRSWVPLGLAVLDGQKPHLVLGISLKEFLDNRSAKAKRRLADDQFLCMACGGPRRAYGGMADYVPFNDTRGKLVALCETCEGPCVRFTSMAKLPGLAAKLLIVTRSKR